MLHRRCSLCIFRYKKTSLFEGEGVNVYMLKTSIPHSALSVSTHFTPIETAKGVRSQVYHYAKNVLVLTFLVCHQEKLHSQQQQCRLLADNCGLKAKQIQLSYIAINLVHRTTEKCC